MPKRKIPDSLLPPEQEEAALAAMRQALAPENRHELTAEEERDFQQRRARGNIERHEYIVTERRGKLVYREHGKGGADLPVPPFYRQMLERQRDFETECAKVDRTLRTLARNRGPRTDAKAEERARLINAEFDKLAQLPERNRASVIAKKLGIPVRTVREVLRKQRR